MKTLRKRLDETNPFEDFEGFNEIIKEYEAYYREILTEKAINNGVALLMGSQKVLVTNSTREDVKYQVTFFDSNCEPTSHKDLNEINYRDIPMGYELIEDIN